jgi:hypothetical protein
MSSISVEKSGKSRWQWLSTSITGNRKSFRDTPCNAVSHVRVGGGLPGGYNSARSPLPAPDNGRTRPGQARVPGSGWGSGSLGGLRASLGALPPLQRPGKILCGGLAGFAAYLRIPVWVPLSLCAASVEIL